MATRLWLTYVQFLRAVQMSSLKSAVLSGLGVLYSMRSTFSTLVTSGALIEILKPFTAASGLDLVALIPEARQIPLRVENFIQMLRAYRWQSTDFGLGPSTRVLG